MLDDAGRHVVLPACMSASRLLVHLSTLGCCYAVAAKTSCWPRCYQSLIGH